MVQPGRYHFVIDSCKATKSERTGNEGFEVEVSIISPGSEAGKTLLYENFYSPKLFDLAAAIGLTDTVSGQPFTIEKLRAMREDAKAGRQVADCDFNPDEAVGRQFCAEVVMGKPKESGKNAGKSFPEIGWDVWSPLAPEAKDIPKNPQAIAELTGQPVQQTGNQGGAAGGSKFAGVM